MPCQYAILLLVFSTLFTSGCESGAIRRDEDVLLFPTCAYRSADTRQWVVPIHGWIFEPERDSKRRWLVLKILAESLDLADDGTEAPLFYERARMFLVDNEGHRSFKILLAGREYVVGRSDDEGHFRNTIRINDADCARFATRRSPGAARLAYQARTVRNDSRSLRGVAYLLEPEGISVISDVDDTIKITDVQDTDVMLENTFLKAYRPVADMAKVYRTWASVGADFHYVTASPWQLFPTLQAFIHQAGFPEGSVHMSQFDWHIADIRDLLSSPYDTKWRHLQRLFETYPRRRFVLVGDSSQDDPELYAESARRYPRQVEHIFIRALDRRGQHSGRYRSAFTQLPPSLWTIFNDVQELLHFRLPVAGAASGDTPGVLPVAERTKTTWLE